MKPSLLTSAKELGDFQTPDDLAHEVVALVKRLGIAPRTVVEPTCGRGAFLIAAEKGFPDARLIGLDINKQHLSAARARLCDHKRITLIQDSFFKHDWLSLLATIERPLLVVGNPPWVTNAELGSLGSDNLPEKRNFQNLSGIDAVTGKSNFDISEWMLLRNMDWLSPSTGALAVLCKVAVARKVLAFAWSRKLAVADARMYRIDAIKHFGAAVDACLLVARFDGATRTQSCSVYADLRAARVETHLGYADDTLVSNRNDYLRYKMLRGKSRAFVWRSGIKHDCAKVMELALSAGSMRNGLGDVVEVEDTHVFPLVKSSDIAGSRQEPRERFVIVPQRTVGEDTMKIRSAAPRTWDYLSTHRESLRRRTSSIYKNKPDFSIFGVGPYTFAPWKIAISGLYKNLTFKLFGPRREKPGVFDDTVYFLPFETKEEAVCVLGMLASEPAQSFLRSMIFWDEKRPITADLLRRLDISKLAEVLALPPRSNRGSAELPTPLELLI